MTIKQQFIQTLRHIRLLTLSGLKAAGAFTAIANSSWRQQRLLILCYHGVALRDEHEWDPQLFVTPEFLRRRFSLLRGTGCNVLPLDIAFHKLQNNSLPPRSVVLTFDDGFYNFLAAAVPVLKEFDYPATNYVSSYHSIHQRPILQLVLRYIVWRARKQTIPAGTFPWQTEAIDLTKQDSREQLYGTLLVNCRALSHDRDQQEQLLREYSHKLGVDWDQVVTDRLFHLMTAEELAETARQGVDIQLHTHRHRTPRQHDEFRQEIEMNRNYLQTATGTAGRHFCYPSGDVDPMFLPWLREMNVATATTGIPGLANRNHDSLLLPRYVDTMLQSELTFESWLTGASEVVKRRRA